MAKQDVRPCQNCHGNGRIIRINKKGIPVEETCIACGGTGKIIISTI